MNDFNNLILREMGMLAFIVAFKTIYWLSLMVDTGLLLALIEDLISVT
jgi:hypothetical protein